MRKEAQELQSSLGKIAYLLHQTEEQAVKEWFPRYLDKKVALTVAECHSLDFIEKAPGINGTILAESLKITRGGMSKILAKLQAKGWILVETSEKNKKERYYYLTEDGKKISRAHQKIHDKLQAQILKIFEKRSLEEQKQINRFLAELSEALILKDE
jgi:Transcriptional regulators